MERVRELKPGDYHTTVSEKILAGVSGAMIGGAIGIDIFLPGFGKIATSIFCLGVPVGILGGLITTEKAGWNSSDEKEK